ncbi:P-loop NTPase fold protein [Bacillus thuringiensis]|uniref:P-loop NTPase fold protein n=1 Tax=Bacillus thuringiensis TaxID=1428 RepID=UPI003D1078E5
MKANEIINVLNLFKDSSYQKVLIRGNWGIGKTEYVSKFIKSYKNVCYISLFGKKDINSIIQEIYFEIVKNDKTGTIKKYWRQISEKLNKFNISYHGFSLSIPLIGDLYNRLYNELGHKDAYIIIFDDLERKHDDLNVKEILGLIDNLSKIENIKTVLIAATEQLDETSKLIFNGYQEKAIDRVYTIGEYAAEAPVNILGQSVWNTIGTLVESLEFKNLRTFEKTNLFIREVVQVLGQDIFSNKFTRNDLYRMCFAAVFFHIEHNNELKLLNEKDSNFKVTKATYSNESGNIEYLCHYILKDSMDNIKSKSVFYHIKNWFETGAYSKEIIIDAINFINNNEDNPINYFSSEQEIQEDIEYSRKYIRGLTGNEKMIDIISVLSNATMWSRDLSIDFGISIDEILTLIKDNISNHIDLEKNNYENKIDSWRFTVQNKEFQNILNPINRAIDIEYYEQLLKRINECLIDNSYNKYSYIQKLIQELPLIKDDSIRNSLVKDIKNQQFFFPIPSGKISKEQWYWCVLIEELIRNIEEVWGVEGYCNDFKTYCDNLECTKQDKMLQIRLKEILSRIANQ